MVPAHMEAALCRLPDPRRRLHADQVGGQQFAARHAGGESLREPCAERRSGGMDHAVGMGVVIVEAVDQHPVDQGCIAHRQADIRADHRRRPLAGEPRMESSVLRPKS